MNLNRVPAVFPGSFNPLHDGHRLMRKIAEQVLEVPVCYELSCINVDKPELDSLEVEKRLKQFGEVPCWITRASRFTEKATLFPGTTFVVGADTIQRIAAPRYYDSPEEMQQAVEFIQEKSCRFLVFGRLIEDKFHEIPERVKQSHILDLCEFVPESLFRMDLSSTELRKRSEIS